MLKLQALIRGNIYEFNKVTIVVASCDHQKSKLRAVAGAERVWVAGLRVRQLKIGSKSRFVNLVAHRLVPSLFQIILAGLVSLVKKHLSSSIVSRALSYCLHTCFH